MTGSRPCDPRAILVTSLVLVLVDSIGAFDRPCSRVAMIVARWRRVRRTRSMNAGMRQRLARLHHRSSASMPAWPLNTTTCRSPSLGEIGAWSRGSVFAIQTSLACWFSGFFHSSQRERTRVCCLSSDPRVVGVRDRGAGSRLPVCGPCSRSRGGCGRGSRWPIGRNGRDPRTGSPEDIAGRLPARSAPQRRRRRGRSVHNVRRRACRRRRPASRGADRLRPDQPAGVVAVTLGAMLGPRHMRDHHTMVWAGNPRSVGFEHRHRGAQLQAPHRGRPGFAS